MKKNVNSLRTHRKKYLFKDKYLKSHKILQRVSKRWLCVISHDNG